MSTNSAFAAGVVPASLKEVFEAQVRSTPDAPALITSAGTVPYASLNERANALAWQLIGAGLGSQQPVGVWLDRSTDLFVAALAILKCGAAYVPLDTQQPVRRLAQMVHASRTRHVIAGPQESTDDAWADGVSVIRVDDAAAGRHPNPPSHTNLDDLASILFTSGSTGTPKGVLIDHGVLVNRFVWMWQKHPFAPTEVAAVKTSIGFIDSLWELFGALLVGVPTVIFDQSTVLNPRLFLAQVQRHGVSRVWLVPSYLRVLVQYLERTGRPWPQPGLWVSSGEPLPAELASRFRVAMPQANLMNLYGTSEVFDATCESCAQDDPLEPVCSVGVPIDNVRVYVLDEELGVCGHDRTGEVYVAGAGLARGYTDPDSEHGRFLSVVVDGRSERLYRTGDSGRWTPDGRLQILGRRDAQIKINGHRIEPTEVENALRAHPSVADAAVTVDYAATGRLTALLVECDDRAIRGDEVRAHAQAILSPPMVPLRYVLVRDLPWTPSGKIDRKRLGTWLEQDTARPL